MMPYSFGINQNHVHCGQIENFTLSFASMSWTDMFRVFYCVSLIVNLIRFVIILIKFLCMSCNDVFVRFSD